MIRKLSTFICRTSAKGLFAALCVVFVDGGVAYAGSVDGGPSGVRFSALEETGTSGPKQEKTVSRSAGNAVLTFIAAEGVAVGMSFLASSSPKAAGIGMMAASPIPVIVVDDWRVGLTATGVLLGLGAYNRGLANSTDLTNKDILRRNIGAWQVGLATLGLVSYFSDRGAERSRYALIFAPQLGGGTLNMTYRF